MEVKLAALLGNYDRDQPTDDIGKFHFEKLLLLYLLHVRILYYNNVKLNMIIINKYISYLTTYKLYFYVIVFFSI